MDSVRIVATFAVALLASAAGAQQPPPLASDLLRSWYSGASVDGTTETGATFRAYHAPDGKISAIVDGKVRNAGSWKFVEPNRICVSWSDTSWGKDPCFAVSADGEWWKIVDVADAGKFARVKRIEGNFFGL